MTSTTLRRSSFCFRVFEATVRTHAVADVDREMALITHVAVRQAVKELKDAIATGSFGKVTAAFQKNGH